MKGCGGGGGQGPLRCGQVDPTPPPHPSPQWTCLVSKERPPEPGGAAFRSKGEEPSCFDQGLTCGASDKKEQTVHWRRLSNDSEAVASKGAGR